MDPFGDVNPSLASRVTLDGKTAASQMKGKKTLKPRGLYSSQSAPVLPTAIVSGSFIGSVGPNELEAADNRYNASNEWKNEELEVTKLVKGKYSDNMFLNSIGLSENDLDNLMNKANIFFYLQVRPISSKIEEAVGKQANPVRGSIYDLEVVDEHYLNKDFYFTLSKEGVTQFRNNVSQFTTLAQWTREYQLFFKISSIQFFRVYRTWKVFYVWRKSLNVKKFISASSKLQTRLFLFNPPLRRALLSVRQSTQVLSTLGMVSLQVQGEVHTVEKFLQSQEAVHADLRTKLDTLSENVLDIVRSACDEVIDQFLKANNIAADHKMTFMERAALRAECRQLTRFLRLIDILSVNFLKSMVLDAVTKIAGAVDSKSLEPKVETSLESNKLAFGRKRQENAWKMPVVSVTVNFRKDGNYNDIGEHMEISPTLENITRAVDDIINSCLDVVGSFVNVLTCPETEMYVIPDKDEEDGDVPEVLTHSPTHPLTHSLTHSLTQTVDLITAIRSSYAFSHNKDVIHRHLRHSFYAVKDYCQTFEPFRDLFIKNQQYCSDVSVVLADGGIEEFQRAIAEYKDQIAEFSLSPVYADVGVLFVDSMLMKQEMLPSPLSCLQSIREWIPQLAAQKGQDLFNEVDSLNPIISGDPANVEVFVVKKKTKDNANIAMEDYKTRQNYVRSLLAVMDDNQWPVVDSVKALVRMIKDSIASLEVNIQAADNKVAHPLTHSLIYSLTHSGGRGN